jgi:hypothetical protein
LITGSTFAGNESSFGWGGAMYFLDTQPIIEIRDSLIRGNRAVGPGGIGGGILAYTSAVNMFDTIVRGNTATLGGGGVFTTDTIFTVFTSTFTGNDVTAGEGGAIFNESDGSDAHVSLNNSTISGNRASGAGGGIFNDESGAVPGSTQVYLFNVTVARNNATVGGGVATQGGLIRAESSIIGGQAGGGDCASAGGGTVTGVGPNLEQGATCGFTIAGVVPGLDPLAINPPGTTPTHALQAGSPAIDAGPAAGCVGDGDGDGVADTALTTDQRGVARNGPCDLGAYEF